VVEPALTPEDWGVALQQSHVVEDINQNVTQAASLAHNNALAAEQSSDAGRHLGQLAEQLNGLLGQFRV
jgi:methyl-accepting chemotaxis protein